MLSRITTVLERTPSAPAAWPARRDRLTQGWRPRSLCRASRGGPTQRLRREAERAARRRALAFDRWATRHGCTHQQAAARLHLSPALLAQWRRRWHADLLPARPLGRRCQHADRQTRQQIIHFINDNGAGVALEAIQAAFPAVARAEAHHLQTRYRRAYRKRHRRHLRVLHWARPGTVWAMDHSDPPRPVDGVYPQMLAIRDLASGYQLAWLPVESKAAEPVLRALQNLFAQYGPPLVFKCDNGSPFIAEEIQDLLRAAGVARLFHPYRLPSTMEAVRPATGA